MSFSEILFLVFRILGGLALFLLGMGIMTEGLREAMNERFRAILARGTQNRLTGLALGTLSGFLAHSSATTVMAVGFLNAGILSLAQALPVFFGANLGTTLSMQLISFKLDDFAFIAVTTGFFTQLLAPWAIAKNCGKALLGFGLIFWGMGTMSGALEPHRETLADTLSIIDGSTLKGLIYGLSLATLITGVIQSSGAVIGICFALAASGVFTSLEQVFPIVLGAHIGTSVTSIAASIGGTREARRGAIGNLFFNVFNVLLALLMAPLFMGLIPLMTNDLVHQIAHLHTGVMVVAAAVLMPFIHPLAHALHKVIPVKSGEARTSYLDYSLITTPEKAIAAVTSELGRSLKLSMRSLKVVRELVREYNETSARKVKRTEDTVDELKKAVRYYLTSMTRRYLSRRQALMVQYLTHISSNIERIGDHVHYLCQIAGIQHKRPDARFDEALIEKQIESIDNAVEVLHVTYSSLSRGTEEADFKKAARKILKARDHYQDKSERMQEFLNNRVANHEIPSLTGLFYSDFSLTLDRMVRHCKMIARQEQQPFFEIKRSKLNRVEPPVHEKPLPRKLLEGEMHEDEVPKDLSEY